MFIFILFLFLRNTKGGISGRQFSIKPHESGPFYILKPLQKSDFSYSVYVLFSGTNI